MKFRLLTVALAFVSSQVDARITRDLRQDGETSGKPRHHTRTVGTGEARSRTKHTVEAQGRQPGFKSRTKSRTKVGANETPMHHTRTVGTGEVKSRAKHTEAQGRQPGSKSRTKSRTKVGTKETQERQESKPDGEPRDAGCTNVAGWVDEFGDCDFYQSDPLMCVDLNYQTGTDGLTAVQACCVCDGAELSNDDALCNYGGWVDSYGNGCDWYELYADTCAVYSTSIGTDGLTPGQACCVCDGVEPACTNVAGWVDSYNNGCDLYESHPFEGCVNYGHAIGTDGLKPGQACCVCDGVEPADGDDDDAGCNVAGWVDSYNNGCDIYDSNPGDCEYYGHLSGTDGLKPGQACCVCDGVEPDHANCTNVAGWVDSAGDGCNWYESTSLLMGCVKYGNNTGTDGLTPVQACCVCDGVELESDFADCNVVGWADSYGFGCDWYEAYPVEGCKGLGTYIGTDGLTPLQACCVCDGY